MENMNKKRKLSIKKISIGIVILIIIIGVIVFAVNAFSSKNKNNGTNNTSENVLEDISNTEFVTVLSDGTKQNKSEKLKEVKTSVEGLEISNMMITQKDNLSTVVANVKNVSEKTINGQEVEIRILDKNENLIISFEGYINKINPNEEMVFSTQVTADFTNAYDYRIFKK